MRGFLIAAGVILVIGALIAGAAAVGWVALGRSDADHQPWTEEDEDAFWNHVDAGAE